MKRFMKESGGGGRQREGKCVRLNRDRAAELTQPVWSGVGGQQQGYEVIDYCACNWYLLYSDYYS